MIRLWTIIGVRDVAASFRWYQSLLCLHEWGAHEYASLASPALAPPGNGLLLFFRVDDLAAALARARALAPRLEEEPHRNPGTESTEFSIRDPDGYHVTINAQSAG